MLQSFSLWVRSLIVLLAVVAPHAAAQDADDDDDEGQYRNGLIATFRDQNGHQISRVEKTISVTHQAGTPDRRLTPGKISVRWEGLLSPPDNGDFRFYAHGRGRVTIKLRDQVVLDESSAELRWLVTKPIALTFDYLPLEVTYEPIDNTAQFSLFWTGPGFPLEPLTPRFLFHDPKKTPSREFERGEQTVRGLRCGACHAVPGEPPTIAGPSLENISGNMRRDWLVKWLSESGDTPTSTHLLTRRMPHFALSRDDAERLADLLLSTPAKSPPKSSRPSATSTGNRDKGRTVFLTLGCLACHRLDDQGTAGLFVGSDLSQIAAKRPGEFFESWLTNPAALNRQHRMPVFELADDERRDLATFLSQCGPAPDNNGSTAPARTGLDAAARARATRLFVEHRCAACHEHALPIERQPAKLRDAPFAQPGNQDRGCLGPPNNPSTRPGYSLTTADEKSVRAFLLAVRQQSPSKAPPPRGSQVLVERNCVACHARDESPGLAPKLVALAAHAPELAIQIPALTPPSLLSVGDKLHDATLAAALRRTQAVHRPWLKVRMPKFAIGDDELKTLVDYFVAADRIADDAPVSRPFAPTHDPALHVAGSRLVTVDGFGCTSCHQIGKVKPVNAPLNARGPDISQLSQRVRLPWFDRWVRSPARIVPGMEMPSVQIPVRGVLEENLNQQLAAVWQVLNTPGFEPPEPNPVKVLRLSGVPERNERAELVTDVLKLGDRTLIKPLLVGLPNRHSLLFDLETNRLARWSVGDVARLRTKGKTWFWEAAGSELWRSTIEGSEFALMRRREVFEPTVVGQFPTELDQWRHIPGGLEIEHRLQFGTPQEGGAAAATSTQLPVVVRQRFEAQFARSDSPQSSVLRDLSFARLPPETTVLVRLLPSGLAKAANVAADRRSWRLGEGGQVAILSAGVTLQTDSTLVLPRSPDGTARVQLSYSTALPVDRFIAPLAPAPQVLTYALKTIPGFSATRLPLPEQEMPTALAWRPDGTLLLASLKGRVWSARDTNGDGQEDQLAPLSDELAAPYGLAATADYVDVIVKYGLLRLHDDDRDGRTDRTEVIASGWGHTDDYHDWAIGLPRDAAGNYFVGLPCQQDKRSAAAAHLRGTVLQLSPREPSAENPRRFSLERLTTGHRFPMGLARNRAGEMFVTDNQGNYNPFNELNHVRRGADFGFVNAIEKRTGATTARPPLTPPVIELPHPWTRSVNGICFLDTPAAWRAKTGRDAFGVFEGHLVGCEYDTRRLIRMSLQPIGDSFQGAAYPLTSETPASGQTLLGPLCCEVSLRGELVVGGIRDSGWGGGNNIGEVVKMKFDEASLPAGIAEMRAVREGFELTFTKPINGTKAADIANYAVTSYRRTSTPAYGGPDQDRRTDRVTAVEVLRDQRRVILKLAEMRPGFVYELRTKKLTADDQPFFPSEAYFTLRRIPE